MFKRFLYYLTRCVDYVYAFLNRLPSNFSGRYLMYHHVVAGQVDPKDLCACSVSQFVSNLNKLSASGYEFVSMDESLEIIKQNQKRKFAVITFDDINEDMFTNAYPVLKKREIPFIVFIAVDYIGKPDFVSEEHLDILAADTLCTIGSHTLSHPMLRYCGTSFKEIQDSKQYLEYRFQREIRHFAYPYGRITAVSRKNIQEVKKAGYISALGTILSDVNRFTSRSLFYLPRYVMKE